MRCLVCGGLIPRRWWHRLLKPIPLCNWTDQAARDCRARANGPSS